MRSKLAEDLIDGRAGKAEKEPSDPQIKAGNYRHGRITVGGQRILIENPAGSIRNGTDKSGQSWSCQMQHHYGYFPFTLGKDGDPVDVFVRKGLDSAWQGKVFVINQKNDQDKFDEHKCVFGATSPDEARQIYRSNYSPGWDGVLSIGEASFEDFRKWLRHGNKKKPFEGVELAESLLLASYVQPVYRQVFRENGRRYIVEGRERLWETKIRENQHHHIRNTCPQCNTVETCRCSAPKTNLTEELCYWCKNGEQRPSPANFSWNQ